MSNKVVTSLIAAALCTTIALASPAFARGGGGGGHGGGGHGGGMGGGMHGGMGGGMHFGAMSGGAHISGAHFASAPFAHAGVSPRFSRFGFRDRHHRFHRFAFVGAPYGYAAYDNCWRRVWTPYGLRWVDVCGDYGY